MTDDQAQAANEPIEIDVISDVMCPWCYIGKRRLEKALAMLPGIEVDIRWRPFQLDHTIPEGGMDRQEYLRNKFGSDADAAQVYQPVRAAGRAESIPFEFEKISAFPPIRWMPTG
jgi:predicted DsbA family dithiol-disulfide isomerase